MARLYASSILIFTIIVITVNNISAKPLETQVLDGQNPGSLIPSNPTDEASLVRDKRQYGFSDYDDYSYGSSGRHLKNKRKHKPIVPVQIHGGNNHGCRGSHGCQGSYHKPSSGGGSFASASAGSFGTGNHGGSQSQAQSASFSFGPFSISTAQAQSSSRGGRGGYGGYGDYGGFDY